LTGKIRTTTFPFLMGQMLPAQPEYNFKGVMDAVKIYDYALPPDEVKHLFEEAVSGIKDPIFSERQTLELSPNPVSDILSVRVLNIDQVTLSHPVNSTVQILDLAGRVVLEQQGLSGEMIELDLSKFKSGLYFVVLQLEGVRVVGKFVKR